MLTAISVVTVEMKYPLGEILGKEIKPVLYDVYSSPEPLGDAFETRLSDLFSLKMKITYYQLLQEEVNWKRTLEEVKEMLPELRKGMEERGNLLLAENFVFALTLAIEITSSLLETSQFEMLSREDMSWMLKIKLEDFINSIRLEALPQTTQENLIKITKTATFLEFAILLAFLYAEEDLKLPQSKIEELSLCLRDWAQLYGALAQELRIWRVGISHEEARLKLREVDIEEEKELADMGLGDYLESILKDEEAI